CHGEKKARIERREPDRGEKAPEREVERLIGGVCRIETRPDAHTRAQPSPPYQQRQERQGPAGRVAIAPLTNRRERQWDQRQGRRLACEQEQCRRELSGADPSAEDESIA